jgi:hypothetical protein
MSKTVNIVSVFASIVAGVCLVGCKASVAPSSGFIDNPDMMSKNETLPFQRTYWNKKYDPKSFTEIMIAPVNTDYVMAQSFWEKTNTLGVSPEKVKSDVAELANYTRESFVRAFADDPKHRFQVVQTAGPKTLILELAIVQIVPSKAVLNAMGYVTWIPMAVAASASTLTGSQDTGKGVVAIEGRIRDGGSGEIIGMFQDREHPAEAIVDLKALSWWAPAKGIINKWSGQLVAVANRPPGGVVKDAPAFELLVW